MSWRLMADKMVVVRYFYVYGLFCALWVVVSAALGKYHSWKHQRIEYLFLKNFVVLLITLAVSVGYEYWFVPELSLSALLAPHGVVVLLNFLSLAIYYGVRYATFMDVEPTVYVQRTPVGVLHEAQRISNEAHEGLRRSVLEYTNEPTLTFLEQRAELSSSNTLLLRTSDRFNIQTVMDYKYDCIVNLMPLNDIRGINKMFCVVNEKLPDNGRFICCYTPQSVYQQQILDRYPMLLRRVVYYYKIFTKRIVPRLILFNRIYYKRRQSDRYLSPTEVLGRLAYCGFDIDDEVRIGSQVYVVARRALMPQPQVNKIYGPLIKLQRVGKGGAMINVYKFRTMHPYAEFIQSYVYEKNSLQEGGKIRNDMRVTSYGAFMRRCWLDEFPMFINLLRADMKLVGVRPLSRHYFSLYSSELQELRIRFKPGLLPPFYVDLPETLEQIQASEMRYLKECEQKGVFVTDFKYFWKIIGNILFKRVRSK